MSLTDELVKTQQDLDETVSRAKKCAVRIINACGEVGGERSLAEADFDGLLEDVGELCTLKTQCVELRRRRKKLGYA